MIVDTKKGHPKVAFSKRLVGWRHLNWSIIVLFLLSFVWFNFLV